MSFAELQLTKLMPKEMWYWRTLLLTSCFCLFMPFALLAFDPSVLGYWQLHVLFSLLLIGFVLVLRLHKVYSQTYYPLALILLFLYPFFIMSAFPFTVFSIGAAFIVMLGGLLLPFVSIKSTWWFYTLGGRMPIPKEHEWLQTEAGVAKEKGLEPKEMLEYIFPFMLVGIGLAQFLQRTDESIALLIMYFLFQFCSFGIGLTFATRLKRMRLFKEI